MSRRAHAASLVAVLLLAAAPAAQASYRNGFAGIVVLALAVPAAVLLGLAGLLMRAAGLFAQRTARQVMAGAAALPAAAAMLWVVPSGDPVSQAMLWIGLPLLVAAASAPAWVRPPPARSDPSGPPPVDRWRRGLGLWWLVTGIWGGGQLAYLVGSGRLMFGAGLAWPAIGVGLAGAASAIVAGALAWRPRPGAAAALVVAFAMRCVGMALLLRQTGWIADIWLATALWVVDAATAAGLAWRLRRAGRAAAAQGRAGDPS